MNIVKMNCPSCGAPLAFGDNIREVKCDHCGQVFTIDDKASEIDRISEAEAAASKRNAEAERRKMEMRLEEEKRKNDEKLRVERKKSLSLFMPFIVLFVILFGMLGFLGIKSCIDDKKEQAELAALADKGIENGVNAPGSQGSFVGDNYVAVQMSFEAAGFTNVQLVPMGDLVTGLLVSEGEVDSVTINGGSFSDGEQFEPDAVVIISYHSFPERNNTQETVDNEAVEQLYDESSYMATTIGNITYVYPRDWGMSVDGSGRVTYVNPDMDVNMFVSASATDVSVEDDDFDDYIAVMAEDVFSGDYEVSTDRVGGHFAKCAQGAYSSGDNVYAKIYFTDYDEGVLIVGFLYSTDKEAEMSTLIRDLLSSFIFAGREEIVYTSTSFGNTNFDVPETWEITEQSSDRIVYQSADGVTMMVSYQAGDFSISDDGFIETMESQIIWDELNTESITLGDTPAYFVSGINNQDGGYSCRMYMADSEPGIVNITFYYYPEYELLYGPQIDTIVSSVDIQG